MLHTAPGERDETVKTGVFFANVKDAYPGISDELILLEKVRELGFSHIELDLDDLGEKSPAFFAAAERLSLGFSVYAFADESCVMKNGRQARSYLPFLREKGIKNLMMVCRPGSSAADRDRVNGAIISSLNSLCSEAAKYGVTVLAEDFDSSDIPCGSCEDMLFFGERVPLLRFTFDTGNFAFFGEDALECFGRLSGRIAHVHLKDRVSAQDLTVTVTGRGGLPIGEILDRLAACGYDGLLSVEMFGAVSGPGDLRDALLFVTQRINR